MVQSFLEAMKRNNYLTFVIVFSGFFAAINFVWMLKDHTPPPWDQAWYLQNSQELYYSLLRGGVPSLLKNFAHALGGVKAPLVSVLPLPFYLLFGNSLNSALLVNLSFSFLLSYYLFKLVSLTENKRVAITTVIVTQTIPLSYSLSRQFLVEYVLTTLVVMFVYYLVSSNYFVNRRQNIIIGVIFGFGLLAKSIFPLYVFGPLIYCLCLNLKNKSSKSFVQLITELVKICLIASMIASIFYLPNGYALFVRAFTSGYGELSKYYGLGEVFALSTIITYWKLLANSAISLFYTLGLLLAFCYLLIIKFLRTKYFNKSSKLLYFVWFIIPFLIFTFGVNKDPRFLLPILPALAVMIGLAIDRFSRNVANDTVFVLLCLALLSYPYYKFIQLSFFHVKHDYVYLHYPSSNDWKASEVVNYIYSEADKVPFSKNMPSRYMVVAVEHPAINLNTYDYISSTSLRYLSNPVHFTSLGFAETDIDKALDRITKLDPLYIVFADIVDKNQLAPFLNALNVKIRALVDNGQLSYSYDKTFDLDDGSKIFLFKKHI